MEMKERPILFNGAMVRAILDGRKQQTRRLLSPQPPVHSDGRWGWIASSTERGESGKFRYSWPDENGSSFTSRGRESGVSFRCPYGSVGDGLWVRREHYRFGHWEEVPGVKTKQGRMKWRFVADTDEVLFDPPESFRKGRHHRDSATPAWHKRLARFMPRSFADIFLEITGVRVERLNEISEEDAIAEGVIFGTGKPRECRTCARGAFMDLWESINGVDSWLQNPFVWVVEFKRLSHGR
jgi:hypothetical protein